MNVRQSTTWTSMGLALLVILSVGCASDCGTCNRGLFGNRPLFANQPVRTAIRSWFRGDQCDTCNVPTGQFSSPNVAPLCNSCGTSGQPAGQLLGSPSVTTPNLYGAPSDARIDAPTLNGNIQPSPDMVNGNPPTM